MNPTKPFLLAIMLATFSLTSQAAILKVDGNGILTGASNVIVNNASYDVNFAEGTCAALFNGCDSSEDFPFQTSSATSYEASQALLDQVFTGSYDTTPSLTFGCTGAQCEVFTPWHAADRPLPVGILIAIASAMNVNTVAGDYVTSGPVTDKPALYDTTVFATKTYAVWTPTPVPAPPAALLMGSGLLSTLGFSMRRKKPV